MVFQDGGNTSLTLQYLQFCNGTELNRGYLSSGYSEADNDDGDTSTSNGGDTSTSDGYSSGNGTSSGSGDYVASVSTETMVIAGESQINETESTNATGMKNIL